MPLGQKKPEPVVVEGGAGTAGATPNPILVGLLVGAMVLSWVLPWAWLLYASGSSEHAEGRAWLAGILLVALNAIGLFGALLPRDRKLPTAVIAAGFVLTICALLGTWAAVDLVTARGTSGCFYDLVTQHAGVLNTPNALYFAVSLITTVGFGDIYPHSQTCRDVVSVQMIVGLPMVGLSVAAVSVRLFKALT
jgi:voltage-gated potassium channel